MYDSVTHTQWCVYIYHKRLYLFSNMPELFKHYYNLPNGSNWLILDNWRVRYAIEEQHVKLIKERRVASPFWGGSNDGTSPIVNGLGQSITYCTNVPFVPAYSLYFAEIQVLRVFHKSLLKQLLNVRPYNLFFWLNGIKKAS